MIFASAALPAASVLSVAKLSRRLRYSLLSFCATYKYLLVSILSRTKNAYLNRSRALHKPSGSNISVCHGKSKRRLLSTPRGGSSITFYVIAAHIYALRRPRITWAYVTQAGARAVAPKIRAWALIAAAVPNPRGECRTIAAHASPDSRTIITRGKEARAPRKGGKKRPPRIALPHGRWRLQGG